MVLLLEAYLAFPIFELEDDIIKDASVAPSEGKSAPVQETQQVE